MDAASKNTMYIDHYTQICITLVDTGVKFVIAGGVAVALHGVQRLTIDIDVSIEMSRENLDLFLEAMQELNMVPRAPVPATFILKPENRQQIVEQKNAIVFTFHQVDDPLKQLDVFLTEACSYEKLVNNCAEMNINGRIMQIASIDKLIEMKSAIEPPRPKDLSDIAELTRVLRRQNV